MNGEILKLSSQEQAEMVNISPDMFELVWQLL